MKKRIFKRSTAILLTLVMMISSIATPVLAQDYSADNTPDEVLISEVTESPEDEAVNETEVPVGDTVEEQSLTGEEEVDSEQVPEEEIFVEEENEPETLVGDEGEMTWYNLQQALNNAPVDAIVLTNDIVAPEGAEPLSLAGPLTVTIDLNGYTIDRGLSDAAEGINKGCVFYINTGTLVIKDSGSTGVITGGYNRSYGGAVTLDGSGSFILESGTISGNKAGDGGAVSVGSTNSSFTLGSDGTIRDNTATRSGGALYIDGGTCSISGGTITGNTAGDYENGGGLFLKAGTCNISGGTITANHCGVKGCGIYANAGTSLHMADGSAINISENTGYDNLYLSEGVSVTLDSEITDGSSIYVTTQVMPADSSSVAIATRYDCAECFKSDNDNYTIGWDNDNQAVVLKLPDPPMTWDDLVNEVCYGSSDTVTLRNNVIATDNPQEFTINSSREVTLDLNGYKIDRGLSGSNAVSEGFVIRVNEGILTVKDSVGGGCITGGNNSAYGGAVIVDFEGSFILEGGSITGNYGRHGGAVATYSDGSSFTLKEDGTITCNTSSGGGAIYVYKGTCNIEGGTISENITTGDGGGLYLDRGTCNISGGTISANKCESYGGGIYVKSSASLHMSGGSPIVISDNLENFTNENLYLANGASITLDSSVADGSVIGVTSQTAPTRGNPVTVASNYDCESAFISDDDDYVIEWNNTSNANELMLPNAALTWDELQTMLDNNGTRDMDEEGNWYSMIKLGADITADSDDSALTYRSPGDDSEPLILDLCGHTIDRNLSSSSEKGNVLTIRGVYSNVILRDSKGGGKVTGGNNTYDGGAVIVEEGTFTLEGGTITGNKTAYGQNGGGVYTNDGNFNMSGGTISENSSFRGGGVYISSGTTFTMTGGIIKKNTVDGLGGGVYLDNGAVFKISGNPVVTGNEDFYMSSDVLCNTPDDKITVVGPLTDGASIGLAKDCVGILTTGYAEYCEDVQPETYFTNDESSYTLYLDVDSKEVAIEIGHTAAEQPEWEWADDCSSAAAVMKCANCGQEMWRKQVTEGGISGPVFDEDSGKLNYTATVTYDGVTYSDVKAIYPDYEVDETTTEWADDYSSAIIHLKEDSGQYQKDITTENITLEEDPTNHTFTITAVGNLEDNEYISTLNDVASYKATFICQSGDEAEEPEVYYPKSQNGDKACFKSPSIDVQASMLPVGATIAGWEKDETVYKIGDDVVITADTVFTASFGSVWSAVNAALQEGKDVTLYSDIQPEEGDTYLHVPSGIKVTLDMNGYTADRGLTEEIADGFVIKVEGSLTLKNGTVKGGYNSGNGGAANVSGVLYFEDAHFTECNAINGGGVYLETGAKAMMMTGKITYNVATEKGGGVYVSANSNFYMTSVVDDYTQFAAEDTTGTDTGSNTDDVVDDPETTVGLGILNIDEPEELETTVGLGILNIDELEESETTVGRMIGIPDDPCSIIENNVAGVEGGGIYINGGQGQSYFNGVAQVINNTKGSKQGSFNNISVGEQGAASATSFLEAVKLGLGISELSFLGFSAYETGQIVEYVVFAGLTIGAIAYLTYIIKKDTNKKGTGDNTYDQRIPPSCTHTNTRAEWKWNSDYSKVDVSIICESCGEIDHKTVTPRKSVDETTKNTHYEASADSNGKTYSDSKDVAPYRLNLSDEMAEKTLTILLAHGMNQNATYTLSVPELFGGVDDNWIPDYWQKSGTDTKYDVGTEVSIGTDTDLELKRKKIEWCNVNYKPGEGNVKGQMASVRVVKGSSHQLYVCTYERDDYDFSGWSVEYAGTGRKYLPETVQSGTIVVVLTSLDAVAQWKSNWTILNEALKKENDISRSKDINAQTEDVDLTVPEAMITTLDMNGNKLNRNLTVAIENTGRAMTISGDLTLKKATVTGAMNSGDGGGVMVENNGKFTLEDVVIENNSTTNGRGAGIYVNKGSTVNISGLVKIQDNKRIVNKDEKTGEAKDPVESTENVYLAKEAKLTVKDKLNEETKIGISMEEPGVFTSGLKDKGDATNFTSDNPDYTVGINKDGEAYLIKKPKFKTYSLLLAGNIGVNFFLELADNSGMDYSKTYMEFTVNGKTQKVSYNKNFKDQNGKGYYGFTCNVSSIQMAEEITAVYHYGDDNKLTVEKKYSIDQYIQKFEKVKSSYDKVTVDFVHALADYGHYIQPYLSAQNGWTIGKDYKEMATHFKKEGDFDFNTIKEKVAPYAIVRDYGTSGVTCTYSLDLQSGTIIKVYLDVSGVTGSWSATLDGKSVKKTKSGTKYVVQIKNVPSHKLQTSHTIVVKTAAGNATIKVSALSYCDGMFNKDGATDVGKRAVSTIYYYNQAARAYIKVHPIK